MLANGGDCVVASQPGLKLVYKPDELTILVGDSTWTVDLGEIEQFARKNKIGEPRTLYDLSCGESLTCSTSTEVIKEAIRSRSGFKFRVSGLDISEYAGEYFDAYPCRMCDFKINKALLTPEFLERHLAKHQCLLKYLDHAPHFRFPINQTKYSGMINNPEVAQFVVDNCDEPIWCLADECIREEWLDRIENWPPQFWTKKYVLRELPEPLEELPENLRCKEIYLAYAGDRGLSGIPEEWIDEEIIDAAAYDTANIFCDNVNAESLKAAIAKHNPRVDEGFVWECKDGAVAELLLRTYPLTNVVWTQEIADYIADTDLCDRIPYKYRKSPAKSAK